MNDRFADARQSLSFLRNSSIKKRAKLKTPYLPATVGLLSEINMKKLDSIRKQTAPARTLGSGFSPAYCDAVKQGIISPKCMADGIGHDGTDGIE